MQPTLVVIAGPLKKDARFILENDELTIGRDLDRTVCLTSSLVSRQHCSIRKQAESLSIYDLGSRNGTFVNGVPVNERVLHQGDVIAVGDSYFRFFDGREEPPADAVEFEETELGGSTILLRREDADLLRPEQASDVPSTHRLERDLRVLVTIATRMGSIQSSDSLQRELLGMILDVVPADRGVLLLCGDEADTFSSVIASDKPSSGTQAARVSRTIVSRVLRDSAALLVNDPYGDEALQRASSLIDQHVCSILCAPLTWSTTTLGALYLDSRNPCVRFDKKHLELVVGIAGIAAMALSHLKRVEWLREEAQRLQAVADAGHEVIGESSAIRHVLGLIARVGTTDSTVLLCGESGTGKELAARAVHRASSRRDGPFVAINCAAIPDSLLESELFGYDKGAFTGATVQRKGQIEFANGGTLFLDEIGELASTLQAKLLRVLQEREFNRLGGNRPVKVDIRLVAATNRDLAAAVKAGTFRQDLYYRLNVVSVLIPPLRDRREDIPLLSSYFASKLGAKCKRRVIGISPAAQKCLKRYDWPGNVRELENAIERAVVLGSSELILPEDLPESIIETQLTPKESIESGFHSAVIDLKKRLITNAVKEAAGNYTEAAKSLGVNPTYLHRLIRNLNLKASLPT